MTPIKVLIVDDSAFLRNTIKRILTIPEIEVVGTAENGKIGVELAYELEPDIITMDIEMPVMNGLEALKEIMSLCPTPVIMVSTLTSEGAEATFEALSLGAIDFITKHTGFGEVMSMKEELISKIIAIATNISLRNRFILKRRLIKTAKFKAAIAQSSAIEHQEIKEISKPSSESKIIRTISNPKPLKSEISVVSIGVSTGGPYALQTLFKALPGIIPVGILITLHMPAEFTKSLANRLNNCSLLSVKEAQTGDTIDPKCAYLAPGGRQMVVNRNRNIIITDEPKTSLFKPSVNVTMNSLVNIYGKRFVGVMMTGMGNDGLEALTNLHKAGGYVIAQDLESCVVGGMPKSVMDANLACEIHPLDSLAGAIAGLFGLHAVS
ncbi:MAG: chemotaxis-specific methylesterase CheB [Ignavibacteria bacterium]|nr:chemotaxis-specific methylesterase CheB [Ignavibacteria bacterium]